MRHRIIVRAVSKQGFFRAGRFWPATNTEVEVDQETVEVLVNEPRLVVVPVPEPKPESKPEPKPAKVLKIAEGKAKDVESEKGE